MIIIDGISYNAEWAHSELKRKAEIINGDNSGRLQGNKDMYLEYVGTFFNYTGKIIRGKKCTDDEWDALYMKLVDPVNDHRVKVPFNQGWLSEKIYISSIEQGLIEQRKDDGGKIRNKWEPTINITFTAMYSQWLASSTLKGFSLT